LPKKKERERDEQLPLLFHNSSSPSPLSLVLSEKKKTENEAGKKNLFSSAKDVLARTPDGRVPFPARSTGAWISPNAEKLPEFRSALFGEAFERESWRDFFFV